MWRMMRWNVFLGFAPGLMWLAMGLSRVRTVGGVDSAAIVTGLCMVIIALAFVQWRRIRRVLAHAKSVEYRVCPECGYSLVDLEEESGTCPECGTAYTRSGLWVVWTRG
jgi:ssDNA-binding Zn-finger/Zn-ribbon topoisomerase 1